MKDELIINVSYHTDKVPIVKIRIGNVIRDLDDVLAKLPAVNATTKTILGELSKEDIMAIHSIGFLLAAATKPKDVSVARDAAVYGDVVIASEAAFEMTNQNIAKQFGESKSETSYDQLVNEMSDKFDDEMSHIKEWEKK